jgi:penicillin amidase
VGKKIKIAGLVFILLIIVILIAGALFRRSVARRGLPDYDADLVLEGFASEVIVYRDACGIPHIYAQDENDLYRAAGYCMAQDRLWQMDLLRRACTGRLSEIFGQNLTETDLLMRSLRMTDKARMVLERTEEHIVQAVEAFALGVNQYIETHQKNLPPEFIILRYKPEKWLPEHSLDLVGYMSWDLKMSWETEVLLDRIRKKFGEDKARDFFPDMAWHKTLVFPDFKATSEKVDVASTLLEANRHLQDLGLAVFDASNNWAVSGQKSVTGQPILANDMHLGLFTPGIWYQMHQIVTGKLNVTGVVLPGQPFIVAGHNDSIAWGFTNVMVDNSDFYLEKINPENPHQYELNGEWKEMEVRKEKIGIRGGQTVQEELRFTHRGPLISRFHDVDDAAISMHWAGNDYSNELRSVYLLNRASGWDDFKEAMSTFLAVSQNTNYADVDGNIGLYCCAGVPIRKDGGSNAIFPGWTDEFDWQGFVPFEELPHVFNPEGGSVSSANNNTVGSDYPYYISHWFALPYRIDRIREMLEEKEKLSIQDFQRMQADQKSKMAEKILPILIAGVRESKGLNGLETRTIEMLSSWDAVLSATSPEASVFEMFFEFFIQNLLLDEMGDELYRRFISSSLLYENALEHFVTAQESSWFDDVRTEGMEENFTDIVQKSFKDTVAFFENEMGPDPKKWKWGQIHRLTLEHPLGSVKILDWFFKFDNGPYPLGGGSHTVCPGFYSYSAPFAVTVGASHRHIYSLADWDESLTVIPTGVSGIPASPFYCDQTSLYIDNRYHPDYFSRERIEKNAKHRMTIRGK